MISWFYTTMIGYKIQADSQHYLVVLMLELKIKWINENSRIIILLDEYKG